MSMIRYTHPWNALNQIQDEMNRLFARSCGEEHDASNIATSQWTPAVDVIEEAHRFLIRADIPGVDPKEIEVFMENGVLSIKGKRSFENKQEGEGYQRLERMNGVFYRRFSLPDTADSEGITAQGRHGVLEIVIPKKEKAKSRKIAVEAE